MPRKPDPDIKDRLLEACLDVLVKTGIRDFSLGKIAKNAGTSPRMLVYHFGSAESLLTEMIMAYSRHEKERLIALLAKDRSIRTPSDLLRFNWNAYLTRKRRHVLTLFIEIYGQCLRDQSRVAPFFQEILLDWIELAEIVLERNCGITGDEKTAWATLIMASCRGLLLDWLASEDTERIEGALSLFPSPSKETADRMQPPGKDGQ
jgi:AcrR family transcriptional regulator